MAWPRLLSVVWPKSEGGLMTDGLSCPDIRMATINHSSSISNKHPSNILFPWNSTAKTEVIDICSPWIQQEFAKIGQYQGQQQWMTTQSNWETWELTRVTKPNYHILHVLRNNRDLQGALNGEMWYWQLVSILSCTGPIESDIQLWFTSYLSLSRWIISWSSSCTTSP